MNTDKLLGVMKENRDTLKSLSQAIGLSRTRLSAKIHGTDGAVFTQPEMFIIKNRYNLNDADFTAIFFADYVS